MASSSHNVPAEAFSPRVLWVGIGCQKGVSKSLIEQAIRDVFRAYALQEDAIAGLATIDTKANEAGLIAFCRDRNLPLLFFEAARLQSVAVPHPSSVIDALVGTPSVAEAAAICACWKAPKWEGCPATAETRRDRDITSTHFSTAHILHSVPMLHVPKQRYRMKGQLGAVTMAAARSLQLG